MNILIFSWRDLNHPQAGGAEISTHEHAKGWVRAGHNVTLFTSYYHEAKRDEIIDGVNVVRKGCQFFGVQWEAFKWYKFSDHPKYNLVIDQFHGIPFFTPLFVKERKLAFIHEVTKEIWGLNPWPKPLNLIPAIFGYLLEPLIFRFIYSKTPFMTVSHSTKKDLMEWGVNEEAITIVHNGINLQKTLKKWPKERKKTLIYLGALSKDKGIEDTLEVFSLLKQKNNDFQFWVIGKSDENYLNYLRKLAKKLGIENSIKFWGYLSEDKKNILLARSHLLINSSVREGWGLVVIEAARMGTPTVGYNVAGLRDSIVDNETGILTEKNTPHDIAESVFKLVEDWPRYIKMCGQAKKWSDKFSWANSVKQSLSLLEKLHKNA